jgi:hypothetical protein
MGCGGKQSRYSYRSTFCISKRHQSLMWFFQRQLIIYRKSTTTMNLDDTESRAFVWSRKGWCSVRIDGVKNVVRSENGRSFGIVAGYYSTDGCFEVEFGRRHVERVRDRVETAESVDK